MVATIYHAVVLDETVLALLAFTGGQAGVIRDGIHAVVRQHLRRFLHALARQAVHDAALAGVLVADEAQQLAARLVLGGDAIADVRPVEARDEDARLAEMQPLEDLAPRGRIRGGRERNARHVWMARGELAELQVLRSEVVTPLRHAVRLVDGDERDRELVEQRQAALGEQALRRHVQEVELAAARAALDGLHLRPVERGVEELGAHAGFLQRRHLVLHERNERRHHDGRAGEHERRHLVAHRLAAARGHEHQRVPAAGHVRHDLRLRAAEGVVAENVFEHALGACGQVGHLQEREKRGDEGLVYGFEVAAPACESAARCRTGARACVRAAASAESHAA